MKLFAWLSRQFNPPEKPECFDGPPSGKPECFDDYPFDLYIRLDRRCHECPYKRQCEPQDKQ